MLCKLRAPGSQGAAPLATLWQYGPISRPRSGGLSPSNTKPQGRQNLDGTWINTDGPLITDAAGSVWKIDHGRVNGIDDQTTRCVVALAVVT